MAALDGLYGEGASDGFLAALPSSGGRPTVTEVLCEDGLVRVEVKWPNGAHMKIDCAAGNVHYLTLERGTSTGLYTGLCNSLPAFFRGLGIRTFSAYPSGDNSRAVLRTRGDWRDVPEGLRWTI